MPLVAWHEGGFNNSWAKPCNDTRPFRRASSNHHYNHHYERSVEGTNNNTRGRRQCH